MPRAAFPATARLRHPRQFRAVFAHGRKFVSPGFVIIAAPGGLAGARLGLALAKRRIARATQRNRVKRVLRESFRYRRHELGAIDVVVMARSRTASMSNAVLFDQLDALWPQVAALDTPSGSGHGPRPAG